MIHDVFSVIVDESGLVTLIPSSVGTNMLVKHLSVSVVGVVRQRICDRISLSLRLPLVGRYAPILHDLGVLFSENGSKDVDSIFRLIAMRQNILRVTLPDAR